MKLKHNGQHVFRVGQKLILQTKSKPKTKKEDSKVRNAEKQLINTLAQGICQRAKEDERRQCVAPNAHPDPPPSVILEKTKTQEEVERHYQKPGTVKENVNNIRGMESYMPPPCILADPKEEK